MRRKHIPLALLLAVTTLVISADAGTEPAHQSHAASAASAGNIHWSSVNGGGKTKTSANYRLRASVGQTLVGRTSGSSGAVGQGYWRGVTSGGGSTCDCSKLADLDSDNFPTSLDLGIEINIVYLGETDVKDASCPVARSDMDCDTFPSIIDVAILIDYLFAGGDPPCDPCTL